MDYMPKKKLTKAFWNKDIHESNIGTERKGGGKMTQLHHAKKSRVQQRGSFENRNMQEAKEKFWKGFESVWGDKREMGEGN